MKIKTADATGLQLDWGLSLALGHEKTAYIAECGSVHGRDKDRGWTSVEHVNADLCMGLIKEYRMDIDQVERYPDVWVGAYFSAESFEDKDSAGYVAETLEIAVARCVIAMKLGDDFECPDKLGVQS